MDELLWDVRAGVLHVTLNAPGSGNAASDQMAATLATLLRSADAEAQAVVLRGAGDDFCVGRRGMAAGPPPLPVDALTRRRGADVIFDCYQAFRDCKVPVIGVVQGRALGFGASIAALCDVTIAADTAQFQVPEMDHKILPTMVMSSMVDRVAPKDLLYLVLTRHVIDAIRAREMKIVSYIMPASELHQGVDALLNVFAGTPKAALAGAKEYVRSAYDMPLAGAVEFARNLHATINSAAEMRRV
jgi:enoyl-CoA hydratase